MHALTRMCPLIAGNNISVIQLFKMFSVRCLTDCLPSHSLSGMSKTAIAITKPRGGGRPRSESTRQTILSAALKLLRTSTLQSITIEAIAKEAGVSKATIYRWWTSKASVIIDAFVENHIIHTPMRHDIHPGEALLAHWRSLAQQYSGWPGRVVAQILAEGQADPTILREFRERFHYGRRAVVREVADRLRQVTPMPGTNTEVLMDVLYSSIYMRLLWGHAQIDEEFIRDFPITVFGYVGIKFDADGHVITE